MDTTDFEFVIATSLLILSKLVAVLLPANATSVRVPVSSVGDAFQSFDNFSTTIVCSSFVDAGPSSGNTAGNGCANTNVFDNYLTGMFELSGIHAHVHPLRRSWPSFP